MKGLQTKVWSGRFPKWIVIISPLPLSTQQCYCVAGQYSHRKSCAWATPRQLGERGSFQSAQHPEIRENISCLHANGLNSNYRGMIWLISMLHVRLPYTAHSLCFPKDLMLSDRKQLCQVQWIQGTPVLQMPTSSERKIVKDRYLGRHSIRKSSSLVDL